MLHSRPEVLLGDDSLSELGFVGLVLSGGNDDGVVTLSNRSSVVSVGLRGTRLLGKGSELLGENGEDVSEGESGVGSVSMNGGRSREKVSAEEEEEEGRRVEGKEDSPNLHVIRVKLNEDVLVDSPGEGSRVEVGDDSSEGDDEIGLLDESLNGGERVGSD